MCRIFWECDIPVDEVGELTEILDRDGNGVLDINEFLGACSRIRGDAKSRDVF